MGELKMSKIMTPIYTTVKLDNEMEQLSKANELRELEKEEGDIVSSGEEIKISKFMTAYFNTLADDDFKSLNTYCVDDGSSLYEKDMYYRSNIEYTYDIYYNTSKAMHSFAKDIILSKIDSVRLKDNVYTIKCRVLAPNTTDISEYFRKYAYDIRYFFNVNEMTSINISKLVFKVLNTESLPVSERVITLKLEDNNNDLKLRSDLEISETCNMIYSECVSNIIDILKGSV